MFFQQHTCGLMLKRFLILKNNLLDVLVADENQRELHGFAHYFFKI